MVSQARQGMAPESERSAGPSYSIRVGGRTFPRSLRPQHENALLDSERNRNGKIAERLLATLPWTHRSRDDFETTEDLVYAYEDSLKLLEQRHSEAADLLWEVCQRTLSVSVTGFEEDDPRRETIEPALVRSRFEQAAFHGFKPDSVLSAELVAQPTDEVYRALDKSIRQTTHRVVQSVFEALDRMVARSVFGLIEWTSESVCKFHFFTENSAYHRTADLVSSGQTDWHVVDAQRDIWTYEDVEINDIEEKESKVRRRHEHHLMKAEKVELPAQGVTVPQDIQPIIDRIPSWLVDKACIVTGEQFRADVIEQKFKDRVWLKEYVKKREIRTHYDPAVVIDKFVLTGWGEKETQEEEERRRDVKAKETRQQEIARFTKSYRTARNWAGWLGGGGVIAFGLGVFGASALMLLGVFCVGLSLWHTHTALCSAAGFYRVQASWTYLAAGLVAMACFWGGWMLALAALAQGAVLAIWIGLGLAMLSGPLLRLVDSWLPGPLFSLPNK